MNLKHKMIWISNTGKKFTIYPYLFGHLVNNNSLFKSDCYHNELNLLCSNETIELLYGLIIRQEFLNLDIIIDKFLDKDMVNKLYYLLDCVSIGIYKEYFRELFESVEYKTFNDIQITIKI